MSSLDFQPGHIAKLSPQILTFQNGCPLWYSAAQERFSPLESDARGKSATDTERLAEQPSCQ